LPWEFCPREEFPLAEEGSENQSSDTEEEPQTLKRLYAPFPLHFSMPSVLDTGPEGPTIEGQETEMKCKAT